jgi:tRNA 2-thiocytidine biosynthesis protein TtcA
MKGTGDPDRIAVYLLKPFARACKEFDLLAGGDRVAAAVSGGKDSRALLELLLRYRRRVPYWYDLVALHVAGDAVGFSNLRPELEPWFRRLGVEYRFVPLELPPGEPLPLDCFRCSWNRRKALFTTAVEMGCKKLAFGHNADDAAAATLMNLMFQGHLETMAPRLEFFDGAVTVIRPLIYLLEKDLDRYGKAAGFSYPPQCPQGLASKSVRVKAFLRQFGPDQEQIRVNLWRAARRVMNF